MSLYGFASRHRRALSLAIAGLAVAGLFSAGSLPSGIYPDLRFPRLLILARGGSLPARAMVGAVARPLEGAAMEVPGVRRVRSRTFRGECEISVLFDPATDMGPALELLQNRVASVRGDLPAGTEVAVERLTLAAFPMFSLTLSGGLPVAELHDQAFYVLAPALSRVAGVGRVEVAASDTPEVEVVADPARLAAAGATLDDLSQAIAERNRLVPAGLSQSGGEQQPVLASGEITTIAELAATPLKIQGGSLTTVGDVAEVFVGHPDRTVLVAGNGRPAATVSVSQQPGSDILAVRQGLGTTLSEAARSLPSGLRIAKVYDLAELVAAAVANVRDAVLLGALLAVLVLVAFLREWRLTAIAALTLPLTVLCTFPLLHALGESINLMSMGGLAVAIGLVIDDAVVVVETLHRRIGQGDTTIGEAIGELTAPLLSSTLTTVVVLAPLGLLSGIAGQFFRALATTLSLAVLISLALALTVVPLLAERLHRHAPGAEKPGKPLRDRLGPRYESGLRRAMAHPRLALAAAALLLLAGVGLLTSAETGFLPKMDEGGFVIDYLAPAGTALTETEHRVQAIERALSATPEVAAYSRRIGSELGLFATEPNKGDVLVRLKARSQRKRSAEEVISDLRGQLATRAPGLEIEFVQLLQDMLGDLEGASEPIEVKLFGDDPDTLDRLGAQAAAAMRQVPGVADVVEPGGRAPELIWQVDPQAAGRFGLTVDQVAQQTAAAWTGTLATALRQGDRTLPVRVRLADAERFPPEAQGRLAIHGRDGKAVPLSALAHPVVAPAEVSIQRENLRRFVAVTARLDANGHLSAAAAEVERRMGKLQLPVGTSFEVGGQKEAQHRSFRELLLAFALAAALVLLVMVAQFRAFLPALLILSAAPLSLGGALLLLRLTGTELNVSAAIGLILLVGLAVKNGIVLLDYAQRLRDQGVPVRESVAQAAGVRLRPILMTTFCTLFGILPLALGLGAGAELQRPLALAVIGGLGLSTLVTLYLVPIVYSHLSERSERRERATNRGE